MSPSTYPYADRFEIHRRLPEIGLGRDEVLSQLHTMANEEDVFWEGGSLGHHVLRRSRALPLHERGLRSVRPCERAAARHLPERHQVRGGDHLDGPGPAPRRGGGSQRGRPVRAGHHGGTGSIAHAILAYREHAAQTRGITRPNIIKPETAHPAFDKACHLFGVELRKAPVDPDTTQVDVDWVRDHIDDQTVALIGSACNYGYGTVDPIGELVTWPSSAASACTSTAASAASSSPSARSSATTFRSSTTGSRA